MNTNAYQNDGEWQSAITWLDSLARSGLFRIPVGTHPPITRRPDGVLEIRGVHTGRVEDECPVGDWIVLSEGRFVVHDFDD